MKISTVAWQKFNNESTFTVFLFYLVGFSVVCFVVGGVVVGILYPQLLPLPLMSCPLVYFYLLIKTMCTVRLYGLRTCGIFSDIKVEFGRGMEHGGGKSNQLFYLCTALHCIIIN